MSEIWTAAQLRHFERTGEEPGGKKPGKTVAVRRRKRKASYVPKVVVDSRDAQRLATYREVNAEAYNQYLADCDTADNVAYGIYCAKEAKAARVCAQGEPDET